MKRQFYSDSIKCFILDTADEILGKLASSNDFSLIQTQKTAWQAQIRILKEALRPYQGSIFFEYSIPRMGRRIDVVLLIDSVIFVLEFKVGEREYTASALDQVVDYALDLKNFHEPSHDKYIAPFLIATDAVTADSVITLTHQNDNLFLPIKTNINQLGALIAGVLSFSGGKTINCQEWEVGRYYPTPTIIEAAMALYNNHTVTEISRSDASAINLSRTSDVIADIIQTSKLNSHKSICFVTGVPGAGKTLVGLNIATKHIDKADDLYSVFLSGNGPLVAVLREALTRDKVQREKEIGNRTRKGAVMSEVKMFVQNIHHFRDDCLQNHERPPVEHVAIFDEAQRAWSLEQTSSFMRRKKNTPNFVLSEPEFLISCLDRHPDWAVVVCLVGGGQEINTGEAGISEWINSLDRSFPDWHVYISSRLTDSEYAAENVLSLLDHRKHVCHRDDLHLAVSMRSFRAEHVSLLVKQMLDLDSTGAQETLNAIADKYKIVLTRDLDRAKSWLRAQARGSERYGLVVSSQAERLKPHAINVKSPMDPVHWFLNDKSDVRSSYYLEDVATEFHVQGLELDWACIVWDADFRHTPDGWGHHSFCGDRWNRINKEERKLYQKNAYRVLLTRARQGMVIVIPEGSNSDHTRPSFAYDGTFEYLRKIGFPVI